MFDYLRAAVGGFAFGDRAVSRFTTVQAVVITIANVFILIALGLSVISIAYSFVQFVVSTGDEKLLAKAQTSLLWGAIGFIIAALAFVLKNVLLRTVGVTFVQ